MSAAAVIPQIPHFTAAAGAAQPGTSRPLARLAGQNGLVDLLRTAWLVTVLICLVTAVILVLQGYLGYAAVTAAVGLAAAINLF